MSAEKRPVFRLVICTHSRLRYAMWELVPGERQQPDRLRSLCRIVRRCPDCSLRVDELSMSDGACCYIDGVCIVCGDDTPVNSAYQMIKA